MQNRYSQPVLFNTALFMETARNPFTKRAIHKESQLHQEEGKKRWGQVPEEIVGMAGKTFVIAKHAPVSDGRRYGPQRRKLREMQRNTIMVGYLLMMGVVMAMSLVDSFRVNFAFMFYAVLLPIGAIYIWLDMRFDALNVHLKTLRK